MLPLQRCHRTRMPSQTRKTSKSQVRAYQYSSTSDSISSFSDFSVFVPLSLSSSLSLSLSLSIARGSQSAICRARAICRALLISKPRRARPQHHNRIECCRRHVADCERHGGTHRCWCSWLSPQALIRILLVDGLHSEFPCTCLQGPMRARAREPGE